MTTKNAASWDKSKQLLLVSSTKHSIMDQSTGINMDGSSDPLNSQHKSIYQQKMQVEQNLRAKAKNLLAIYGDVAL